MPPLFIHYSNHMKKRGLKIISILIGIVIGLIFAEIASRIYYSSKNKFQEKGDKSAYFLRFGMTRKINAEFEKTKGVTRIAFSGDSFTYGYGVAEKNTFPELIEKKINALNQKKVECLNFGLSGANLYEELERLKNLIVKYSPDIIVHGFVLNDFSHQEQLKLNEKLYQEDLEKYRPFLKLEKHSKLLYYIDEAIFSVFNKTGEAKIRSLSNLYDPAINKKFYKMKASLEELIKILSSHKGIVVFFPYFLKDLSKYDFYKKSLNMVSTLCSKYNVEFIELFPYFSNKLYYEWWVHPHDHHPNSDAHLIISDTLLEILKKKNI